VQFCNRVTVHSKSYYALFFSKDGADDINTRHFFLDNEIDARRAELKSMCHESKKHCDSFKTLADFLDKVEHDLAVPQTANGKKELERAQVSINRILSDITIEVNIYALNCLEYLNSILILPLFWFRLATTTDDVVAVVRALGQERRQPVVGCCCSHSEEKFVSPCVKETLFPLDSFISVSLISWNCSSWSYFKQ